MSGIHHMLVHFPLGFWALATLMILVGGFLNGRFADISRAGLLPILVLSLLAACVAIASGFLVWTLDAVIYSPLARNHVLTALWSLGIFSMLTVLVWRTGSRAFDGARKWVLVVLALTGMSIFATTGTIGGHLVGATTQFSDLLKLFGWDVYNTFYVPSWVVAALVVIGLVCAVAGIRSQGTNR
ncbi:heme ABC transporter permease [Marinobacter sp.]|uniref:heme ABC transporter permease n=1 Tax=Marinobacter sp. TaxID=50741 RepID=UPI001A0C97CD|nr:heme ABC transporter permease [Marinobacter sp.]MBE0487256.1 heme ABC transporter permease [Marinobacter sp.]